MAAPQKEEAQEESEDWLVTYADAITLLMAFFVMLLTFAEFDIPAYEELTSALANNIGGREQQTSTQSLKIDVQDIVYEMQADQAIQVGSDEKGVVIDLDANAFFKPASAEIVEAAVPVLNKLAATLSSPNYELFNVAVEGHTDDGQISTKQFPSNWELSTARASSVVRLFEDNSVERSRLQARGYADTRPKVPNRDLEGTPIPENRSTNRRVVLRLQPMSLQERDDYLRAQEFKRRQAEAAAAKLPQGPSVQEQLPIRETPETFTEQERQAKAALEQIKRDIYAAVDEQGKLADAEKQTFKQRLIGIAELRNDNVEGIFREIERFLDK